MEPTPVRKAGEKLLGFFLQMHPVPLLLEFFSETFRAVAVHEAGIVYLLLLVGSGQIASADLTGKIVVVHTVTLAFDVQLMGVSQQRNKSIRQSQ